MAFLYHSAPLFLFPHPSLQIWCGKPMFGSWAMRSARGPNNEAVGLFLRRPSWSRPRRRRRSAPSPARPRAARRRETRRDATRDATRRTGSPPGPALGVGGNGMGAPSPKGQKIACCMATRAGLLHEASSATRTRRVFLIYLAVCWSHGPGGVLGLRKWVCLKIGIGPTMATGSFSLESQHRPPEPQEPDVLPRQDYDFSKLPAEALQRLEALYSSINAKAHGQKRQEKHRAKCIRRTGYSKGYHPLLFFLPFLFSQIAVGSSEFVSPDTFGSEKSLGSD